MITHVKVKHMTVMMDEGAWCIICFQQLLYYMDMYIWYIHVLLYFLPHCPEKNRKHWNATRPYVLFIRRQDANITPGITCTTQLMNWIKLSDSWSIGTRLDSPYPFHKLEVEAGRKSLLSGKANNWPSPWLFVFINQPVFVDQATWCHY